MLWYAWLGLLFISASLCLDDYCTSSDCKERHAGCVHADREQDFGQSCSRHTYVINIARIQEDILRIHNRLRGRVAGGKIQGKNNETLPKAARMVQLDWSAELAHLAELNAKTCETEQDFCIVTNEFAYPGQSVQQIDSREYNKPHSDAYLVHKLLDYWAAGAENADRNTLRSYPKKNEARSFKRFATMVRDKTTHVGCAAVRSPKQNSHNHTLVLTCNYAAVPAVGDPVYVPTELDPGNECSQKSSIYRNLCAIGESYNHENP